MKRKSKILIGVPPAVMAAVLSLVSCEDSTGPSPVSVGVTLDEFSVTLDDASARSGTIIFSVTNAGTEPHEFLVIQTDLAPDALPTEADGSYQEDGPGTQLLDEIEDILPDETRELSIDLAEGNYVLICNRVEVEEDEVESHYAMGMRTAFQAE
ncbi:MAG TPA: hypothetical protein VIE68_08690 [Gemmatimonadota bacterium]|jgi:hypothetical protein